VRYVKIYLFGSFLVEMEMFRFSDLQLLFSITTFCSNETNDTESSIP
jgi:hypothetical protein